MQLCSKLKRYVRSCMQGLCSHCCYSIPQGMQHQGCNSQTAVDVVADRRATVITLFMCRQWRQHGVTGSHSRSSNGIYSAS